MMGWQLKLKVYDFVYVIMMSSDAVTVRTTRQGNQKKKIKWWGNVGVHKMEEKKEPKQDLNMSIRKESNYVSMCNAFSSKRQQNRGQCTWIIIHIAGYDSVFSPKQPSSSVGTYFLFNDIVVAVAAIETKFQISKIKELFSVKYTTTYTMHAIYKSKVKKVDESEFVNISK